MRANKLTASLLSAALMVTGIGAAGCTTTKDAFAADAPGVTKLAMDCNAKRDPGIEAQLPQGFISPQKDGKPGYCIGNIDATSVAALKLKSIKIVWGGNNPANCGTLGCPTYLLTENATGKLADATPLPADMQLLVEDRTNILYKTDTAQGNVYIDLPLIASDPLTGNIAPQRKDHMTVVYNPKTAHFQIAQ